MSTKYWPTVFAIDMACDLVAHLEAREPELAKMLWDDHSGCFERPTLTKEPQVLFSIHIHCKNRFIIFKLVC